MEDEDHQLLKHLLVLLAFHELVEELVIDHSLLDFLLLKVLQFGLDLLLFAEELLEVARDVCEFRYDHLDLVLHRELAGSLTLFLLRACSARCGFVAIVLILIVAFAILTLAFLGSQLIGRLLRCIVVDLLELGMQMISYDGALEVAIALAASLVLHVEGEVVEALRVEELMLCEFAASVCNLWIFSVAHDELLLTRRNILSVVRTCELPVVCDFGLLRSRRWLHAQLGLVVAVFLDSVLAVSDDIAADPSLQLHLLVVADLNIHVLTLLQRIFVCFHEARGRILIFVELLLVL